MPQTLNLDVAETVGEPYYISTAGTYVIKQSACTVLRLLLGCSAACVITVYDGDDIKARFSMQKETNASYTIGMRCYTNLRIVTSADADVTAVYT